MKNTLSWPLSILLLILSVQFTNPAISSATLYILGVDESGSYQFRPHGSSAIEQFIVNMKTGDTLLIRRISSNSYPDNQETLMLPAPLRLPQLKIEQPRNRFDLKAQKKYKVAVQNEQNEQNGLKSEAIMQLRSAKPINSKKTDIYGFLAACVDRFSQSGNEQRKVILIASDMVDNCKRKTKLDLQLAEVVVLAFQKGNDPGKTAALKNTWEKELKEMNASRIVFLNSDGDLVTSLLNETTK